MIAKSNDNVNRLDATSFLRGDIASGFVFDPKQALVSEAMAGVGAEKDAELETYRYRMYILNVQW
jgi:hypothetical protein